MRMVTATLLLLTSWGFSQSLNLNNKANYADNRSRTTVPIEQVTYAVDLPMHTLRPLVSTNQAKINVSLSVDVRHARKIAQQPSILVAKYDPPTIKALFKLRQQYIGIMNQVAYDTSDAQLEGVPNNISMGYGSQRSNVIKKSERDKESIQRRAEQTALNYLQQVTRTHFRIESNSITDKYTHHFNLPPGQYIICIQQRVKDDESQANMGSKTAIWWTPFAVEEGTYQEMFLDESNAITWRDIFVVETK